MKRFLLVCAVLCGMCVSCVIPGGVAMLDALTADPVRHLIQQYDAFFPGVDLTVRAYYNDGEVVELPYTAYASGYSPPDTTSLGEQTGSVTYKGKTAYFQIFVYDSSVGPPGGSGPIIVVPVR